MGAQGKLAFCGGREGRREAPAAGKGGRAASSLRPQKALLMRLPPPTTRWRRGQRGSPAREVGGERGEGRRGWNKKAAPRNAEAGPRAWGGGHTASRRRARAYFFLSFAPPALSMASRSPRRLQGRRPPGSLRPKRWLPPHAGREGEAGPEVRNPSWEQRQEEQAAIAGLQAGLGRAFPRAACQGPARRLAQATTREILASPQTRRLCALWSRGSGRGRAGAEARSGSRGQRGGECRGRARPRSLARAPASPPHLRGRRVPWKPMVRDVGDQAPPQPTSVSANQKQVSWGTAGTRYRSHVLICVQLRRKEKGSRVRPTWVWDPALGRLWLTLGGAAEKGFQFVGTESASHFLLSVEQVSSSLSPRRLCCACLPPALPSPSSKKQTFRVVAANPLVSAQMCYNGVFLARYGPGHQPHSARANTRVLSLSTKFLWWSLITEWMQKYI